MKWHEKNVKTTRSNQPPEKHAVVAVVDVLALRGSEPIHSLQNESKWILGYVMAAHKDIMAIDKLTELALKAGNDQQALSNLIDSMADYTHSIIYNRMDGVSITDKEDMFQEIMYQLCRSIGKFKAEAAFKTWFSRIAMNKIADHFRHKKRNKEILMSKGVNIDYDDLISPSEWPICDDLITLCSQKNASIVYDKVVNGYTFNEIADRYDLTYEAARSRYRRQMIFLAKEFNENGNSNNT